MKKHTFKGVCEICNCKLKIEIHHKNRNHKDNKSENLQRLCGSCHSIEHNIDKWRGETGFTLTDYFQPQRIGYRLILGFNMLNEDNY